jgi:hypothetical protein
MDDQTENPAMVRGSTNGVSHTALLVWVRGNKHSGGIKDTINRPYTSRESMSRSFHQFTFVFLSCMLDFLSQTSIQRHLQ